MRAQPAANKSIHEGHPFHLGEVICRIDGTWQEYLVVDEDVLVRCCISLLHLGCQSQPHAGGHAQLL